METRVGIYFRDKDKGNTVGPVKERVLRPLESGLKVSVRLVQYVRNQVKKE